MTHNKVFKTISRRVLSGILLLTVSVFTSQSAYSQYVHTQGTKIVDENGNDLFFSGINLGNWLLWEGYLMMGDFNYRTHTQFFNSLTQAFGGDASLAREFEHQWRLNYVDEKAIADLSALGFNSVRVPFHYNMFWQNGQLSNHGFQYFDRVINACRTHGMYVLLDMHAAPGYQNPGDHADNIDSNASQPRDTVKFWDGTENINIASQVWRHIANYYKNEPVVWGYDLINEPVPQAGREYELLGSLITMRNAIREVDNNHVIVAEGSWWSSDLTKIDWTDPQVQAQTGVSSQWDDNLVYQIHHYGPVGDTTHRDDITRNMGIPIIIGEFGETDNGNLKAITDWAKQETSGYFPWSFKKMSHDKTLWTIPPNNAYNEVKNFINSGGTPPTNNYAAMIDFAQNNIRNGHSSHTWHQSFFNAVNPMTATPTPTPEPTPAPVCDASDPLATVPGRVEAESYCAQSGIQEESTSDTGGGHNIGWIDAGDWTEYRINVAQAGTYTFTARVASAQTTGSLAIVVDGNKIGELSVPLTNGWQSWQNISISVHLESGEHLLRLDFTGNGFNLNWFDILSGGSSTNPCDSASAVNLPGSVEAENYCASTGILTEATSDAGGGDNIGWIDAGDWAEYKIAIADSADVVLNARVASEAGGGQIDVLIDNENVGSISVPATGGWQSWQTLSIPMSLNAGEHSLRLNFSSGGLNVNWISFAAQTPVEPGELSGTYRIINALSGKALDVSGVSSSNGANIQQWSYGGGNNQHWVVTQVNESQYEIVSLHSGLCLDADSDSSNIHQWDCHGNNNQRWIIEAYDASSYIIRTADVNGVVEVSNASSNDGANVQTASPGTSNHQRWIFELL